MTVTPYRRPQHPCDPEGYFRMARGIDESGCESIVVAADVAQEPRLARGKMGERRARA
jgi:hypothetical protein